MLTDSDSEPESQATEEVGIPPQGDETRQTPVEDNDWREALKIAVVTERTDAAEWSSIQDRLGEVAMSEALDGTVMDEIIKDIVHILVGDKSVAPTSAKRKGSKNNGGPSGVRREKDRTREAKYRYAKYQEAYNKCPGKLANLAMAGKDLVDGEEGTIYPETVAVRELYTNLWELRGPSGKTQFGLRTLTQRSQWAIYGRL